MNLENSTRCAKDKLVIEDQYDYGAPPQVGDQEAGGPLVLSSDDRSLSDYRWRRWYMKRKGEYCGHEIPHDFFSNSRTVRVSFLSDGSVTDTGFRLEYSAVVCPPTYNADNGRILSPGWPYSFRDSINCNFTVSVAAGKTISLYFSKFSIRTSPNCTNSYLEIRDGGSSTSPLVAKLCGYSNPDTIHSSGNELWFSVKSNSTRYSSRYDIAYTTSETRGCGGMLYDTSGVVTSPNFPAPYNQTSDCYWTLKVPPGQLIEVKFTSFHVGASRDRCGSADYIEIIDGQVDPAFRRLTPRYCGTDTPAVHTSDSNIVTLHYVTSTNNSGMGWRALYQIQQETTASGSSPTGGFVPHP